MRFIKSLIKPQPLFTIGFLLLIIYVGIRAALVDMTHDEAWSFHSIKNFWYVEFLCTGNSHWLNSAAMKLPIVLGCESVFCLRWFSILSFVITCLFGLWFISQLKNSITKFFAFSLLFLHPYFLDYFGMARGYSNGIMFQCLSLLFFIEGLKQEKRSFLFASLIFSGLSAISNYSFICFFIAFTIIYFLKIYYSLGKTSFKNKNFYFDIIFSLGISVLIGRALIFILKCSGDVIGAGEPSFLTMFDVFWNGLINFKFSLSLFIQSVFSLFVFLSIFIICLFGIIKRKEHNNLIYYYTSLILGTMFLLMMLNYFCFTGVFPFYRSALLLFIPSFIVIGSFFDHFNSSFKILKPILGTLSFLLGINFFCSINFKSYFDYHEQADAKECFEQLQDLKAKHIGISPELYGVFYNYYQASDAKKFNFIGNRIETYLPKGICKEENKLAEFDYLLLFPPYDLSYYKNSKVHLEYVSVSPTTKNIIVRIQKKP
jgi:hypothetical protein